MLEQGIDVHAINFTSPFCTCTSKEAGCAAVITAVKMLGGIPLKRIQLGNEYLKIVQNPKHGHGSGLNPCIDCRILKIRKAAEYMYKIGASFLFTGEVLDQRPMSQHRETMALIDRESDMQGYILRPLSASHFESTVPEIIGWVDRSKLLGISGRSRKRQVALATEVGISDDPCPAGGCLLTDKNFSDKMRDYFMFTNYPSIKDIPLLKTGRHFRLSNGDKVIVAHNESECKQLKRQHREGDHLLDPLDFAGPTVILQGNFIGAAVEKMLAYTKQTVPKAARIIHRYQGIIKIVTIDEISKDIIHAN